MAMASPHSPLKSGPFKMVRGIATVVMSDESGCELFGREQRRIIYLSWVVGCSHGVSSPVCGHKTRGHDHMIATTN